MPLTTEDNLTTDFTGNEKRARRTPCVINGSRYETRLSRQEIRHDNLGIADANLDMRHRQYLRVRKDRITFRKCAANRIKGSTRPKIILTGTIHNKTVQIMTMPLIDRQIDSIVQFGESTLQHPLFGDIHQIHAPPQINYRPEDGRRFAMPVRPITRSIRCSFPEICTSTQPIPAVLAGLEHITP